MSKNPNFSPHKAYSLMILFDAAAQGGELRAAFAISTAVKGTRRGADSGLKSETVINSGYVGIKANEIGRNYAAPAIALIAYILGQVPKERDSNRRPATTVFLDSLDSYRNGPSAILEAPQLEITESRKFPEVDPLEVIKESDWDRRLGVIAEVLKKDPGGFLEIAQRGTINGLSPSQADRATFESSITVLTHVANSFRRASNGNSNTLLEIQTPTNIKVFDRSTADERRAAVDREQGLAISKQVETLFDYGNSIPHSALRIIINAVNEGRKVSESEAADIHTVIQDKEFYERLFNFVISTREYTIEMLKALQERPERTIRDIAAHDPELYALLLKRCVTEIKPNSANTAQVWFEEKVRALN